MCDYRKAFSFLPFRCPKCGFRTPYDRKTGQFYPYLHHGTKKGEWFYAWCKQCGVVSKPKGMIWPILGGAAVGAVASKVGSLLEGTYSMLVAGVLLIPLAVLFIVAIAFVSLRWEPNQK